MMNNSLFNNPKQYDTPILSTDYVKIPEKLSFDIREGEKLFHTFLPANNTPLEEVVKGLNSLDIAIIEEIARSKFLTSLQIYEYVTMRGFTVTRPNLRNKILKLMKLRLIQENEIKSEDAVRGVHYCELDAKGYQLVKNHGILFHMGNRYLSYRRKEELGMQDSSYSVKRVLLGNQIVLGMLKNGVKLDRFGIMETFCVEGQGPDSVEAIFRTAANVRIDKESVLAYEVVRDVEESYTSLQSKVSRYYALVAETKYLQENHHGDSVYPQLVLCGESREHNQKIVNFLKEQGLWREEDPILFTEDLLNLRDSARSLYEITDSGDLWYQLPLRTDEKEEYRVA